MSNDSVIETSHLYKKFRIGTSDRLTLFSTLRYKLSGENPTRDHWALKDVSFSVNRGEMIAVIGPNGAGKTTLLRILSGIMAPTSGSFTVREEISCIFELGLGFNQNFTAIENVYQYAALHGISRREIDRRLPEIIEFSELEGFMGAKLGEYSSGMRARLAFATVIQTVRGIVMVDEVLSVGDMSFQKKCMATFQRLLSEGNTILFIAHGLGDMRKHCTRALYLDRGAQMGFGGIDEMERLYE
ncbi:MAG: ABC transporter ATP-binding protein, partial [Endomicrobiales bacterium]